MQHARDYPPINDYAVIGDCHTAALISRSGSIDWLALPHYASPSTFAALLDRGRGGCFAIRPTADFETRRAYRGDSNVLDTQFTTGSGRARLTDCMTVPGKAQNADELLPQAELLRLVEGMEGDVELDLKYAPRPHYSTVAPSLRLYGGSTVVCGDGAELLTMHGDTALSLEAGGSVVSGKFRVRPGERRWFSLTYCEQTSGVILPLGSAAQRRLAGTVEWWQSWSACCSFSEPYRNAVVRSALVLKLLSYSLSGALIAAPTTSLPEHIGGQRNWDYRYCWLRDASLALRAFIDLNYFAEGAAFLSWLLHATRLTRPELRVLYDIWGEHRIRERTLEHLQGYRGSRPVRVGNAASDQFQLDVYGAVLLAARLYVERGGVLDRGERKLLSGFGRIVLERWQEPDHGIWEIRGEKQQYTISKVMCWVALESLASLCDIVKMPVSSEALRSEQKRIRDAIERRGFNASLNSYVDRFDGNQPDASLLVMARTGYIEPRHERMRGTFAFIERKLGVNAELYRYPPGSDGLPGQEGTFGLAGFWAIDYLARCGERAEATARFEELLALGNDVGLFAEEMDPGDGSALGNFPQAYTHLGVIMAAMSLKEQL